MFWTLTLKGLLLLSDTRTNAGVDNVSTYCKMYHFQEDEERMIVLLSSGNLAVTQAVLHRVTSSNFKSNEDSEKKELPQNLKDVAELYQAAELVGDAVREVYQHDGKALEAQGAGFQVSFLLGGQMRGEPMRLFQIYSAGNFTTVSTLEQRDLAMAFLRVQLRNVTHNSTFGIKSPLVDPMVFKDRILPLTSLNSFS